MLNLSVKYRRIAALMMDMMLIAGISKLLFTLLALWGIAFNYDTFIGLFSIFLIQAIIGTLYVIVCQLIFGGTIGKRLLNIAIYNEKNEPLEMADLISREFSKWIILYFFSLIAIVVNGLIYFNSDSSIHDKLSKTHVA